MMNLKITGSDPLDEVSYRAARAAFTEKAEVRQDELRAALLTAHRHLSAAYGEVLRLQRLLLAEDITASAGLLSRVEDLSRAVEEARAKCFSATPTPSETTLTVHFEPPVEATREST